MPIPNLFSFLSSAFGRRARRRLRDPRARPRPRPRRDPEDRYVQNRLNPDQRARLLDRPEVIKAIGKDTISDARQATGPT